MLFSADFYPSAEEVKEQLGQYFNAPEEEDVDPKGDVTILHKVEIKEEDRRYLEKRVADMMDKIPEIDERINEVAAGWRTKRMGKVELTILRLALFEMKHDDAIPEKVAINEAVELAKKFGGDESPSFVNGILAKFAGKEGRKGAAGAVKEAAAKPAEAKIAAKPESAKPVEEADPEAAKSVEAAKPESQMLVEAVDPEASNPTEQQAITAAAPEADKPGSEAAADQADQSPAAASAETAAAAEDEAPSAQTSTASSAEPEKTEAAEA